VHSNLPGKRREVYFEASIYIKELRNIVLVRTGNLIQNLNIYLVDKKQVF
jgi:hypothetical protein